MPEIRRVWIHIRTSEYGQEMYVDGKREYSDDALMGVPDVFCVLKEITGNKSCVIDFTCDDVTDLERPTNPSNYAVLNPETIRRDDITTEEAQV